MRVALGGRDAFRGALGFDQFENGEIKAVAGVLIPFKDGRCEVQLGDFAALDMTEGEAREHFCAEAARVT